MYKPLASAAVLVALFCGCNGSGSGRQTRITGGDFQVAFNHENLTLILERDGQTLLAFPANGLELGRVDALDDDVSYDPWPLLAEDQIAGYTPPEGLRWLKVTGAEVTGATDTQATVTLTYSDGKQAELSIELTGEGNFRAVLTPAAQGSDVAYFRLKPQVDPVEGFYGLGAVLDSVNHRGKIRAMQLKIDMNLESGYNEAHVPIPFIIGTNGWGLFVENPYPAVFSVAVEDADRLEVIFGTGAASTGGLVFHLFAAHHPLDVTRHYYDVTGYPLLPAPWALGPWLWRDENDDQAQVISDVNTMRDLDLATSAIWIDRPYASGVNSFDFDPAKFDDSTAMITEIHDLGFRLALWHTPYLDESDPDTADLLDHATQNGYHPPRYGLLLNHWGIPLDFTNPDAFAWWQDLIKNYTDAGIEGFKLDYGEDVVPGLLGVRNKWEFFDGSDERTMHALYQLGYHRAYAETLPSTGGFLLCRGGTYGDQVNVSVIWPGDLDADMTRHGEVIDSNGDSYTSVGGLPASVIYGLSLGPSGFPFYGSDTGGYRHSPPDKETFTRWFEQTALSSVMQIGTSSNNVAWEFEPGTGFDQEMLDWYRIYVRLHLRLWPYEWTLANNIATDGRPIQRPLGLQYPGLGEHPDDIYMFGDDLLVAPVLERDQRTKVVIFPPGRWIDWWSGTVYDGDQTVSVDAPLGVLPLFQREGSVVPMLRPGIDTLAPTGQPQRVDSYATTPGVLYPRVAAGEASGFTLFDGTLLRQERTAAGITLYARGGAEFDHGILFEVVAFGAAAPQSVVADGNPLSQTASLEELEAAGTGWFYTSERNGSLYVKVSGGEHTVEIGN